MRDYAEAALHLVYVSRKRTRDTEIACGELRRQIETTKAIIRDTRLLIIASDNAIERFRFLPNSDPCRVSPD